MANSSLKAVNEIRRDGMMRGIVVDNVDPSGEGRVAIMVPKMLTKFDPKDVSNVVRTESVDSTNLRNEDMRQFVPTEVKTSNRIWFRPIFNNSFKVPYKGQVVYCFFEDADPQKPYYYPNEASIHGEVIEMEKLKHSSDKYDFDKKPQVHVEFEYRDGTICYHNENPEHKRFAITFRNDHSISINENPDEDSIQLITHTKHEVVLDDLNKHVTARTSAGHLIKMDDVAKSITVRTINGHTIILDDPNKSITIQTSGGHLIKMDDGSGLISQIASTGGKIITGNGKVQIN